MAIIWELALRARRKASAFTAVPSGPWAKGLPVLMPASCCAGARCISSKRSPSLRPAAPKVPLQQQPTKIGSSKQLAGLLMEYLPLLGLPLQPMDFCCSSSFVEGV